MPIHEQVVRANLYLASLGGCMRQRIAQLRSHLAVASEGDKDARLPQRQALAALILAGN